jgi:hypothetical protein
MWSSPYFKTAPDHNHKAAEPQLCIDQAGLVLGQLGGLTVMLEQSSDMLHNIDDREGY